MTNRFAITSNYNFTNQSNPRIQYMSIKILRAILRQDFSSFIHKVFCTINPGMRYLPNWHIDLIADYLENTRKGHIKRLIINMPPRALKSVCVSVAWPAWVLGQDPSKRILAASYSHMLGIKNSMDTRFVMESDWYKSLFPRTILSKKHNQKSKFMTTEHGFRFATSVGGSVTGEGGDILIIDDPHNPTHIHSPKLRGKAIEWFEQTFSSRLNDRASGAIVLVMQRLHECDLSGHLISSAPNVWEVLKIPAISEAETIFYIKGKERLVREGEFLHASRDTLESMTRLEQEIGTQNFAAQYLQSPISRSISMVDLDLLGYYDTLPDMLEYYVHSWDTAIKISEDSDYSVCTIWGVSNNVYYLIDLVRKRMAYPELKTVSESLIQKYLPKVVLIEDKASGQSLIQDLCSQGIQGILGQKPKLDKITRFASVIPLIQAGSVLFPRNKAWMKQLLDEMTLFPHSKHDDVVDSISQFLSYSKGSRVDLKIRGF